MRTKNGREARASAKIRKNARRIISTIIGATGRNFRSFPRDVARTRLVVYGDPAVVSGQARRWGRRVALFARVVTSSNANDAR